MHVQCSLFLNNMDMYTNKQCVFSNTCYVRDLQVEPIRKTY